MSNILKVGEKQKFISSSKVLSDKDGVYEVEITVNPALQKEIYEALYKEKSKNVEIQGFRKGHAPRELVEPKIYSELVEDLVNLMLTYSVSEFISELKDRLVVGRPVLTDYKFSVVETPITFKVKLYTVKPFKLPDLNKIKQTLKSKLKKIEVSEAEVEEALKQLYEQWANKAKKEEKEKFPEPSDEWVKQLKLPGVKDLKSLKEQIKQDILHHKEHEQAQALLNEALDQIIKQLKVKLPEEYIASQVEKEYKAQEQNVSKYGITLEKYLNYYKKTPDQFRDELKQQVQRRLLEELFWAQYINDRNIQVDLKNPKDHVFLNYAAAALRIPPDAEINQVILSEIIRMARLYKALEYLKAELGLHSHIDLDEEQKKSKKAEEKMASSQKAGTRKDIDSAQEADQEQEKKDSKPKILIPGQDD